MQGGEETISQPPPVLSHYMSLPKTSSEIAAMEKLVQFQDTVPCKIRAKRGCATHPRSIAERVNKSLSFFFDSFQFKEKEHIHKVLVMLELLQVRRTRISERMRKLQELVPNMEKVKTFLS